MNAVRSLVPALLAATAVAQVQLPPADLAPGAPYRVMFLTSSARDASSTDIDDYNQFVAQNAAHSGLNGTWRALVSTESVAARDNTATNPIAPGATGVPIYLPNGTRIADDYDELWAGQLLTAPNVGPTGYPSPATIAWTGTVGSGIPAHSGVTFVDQMGTAMATTGDPSNTSSAWIANSTASTTLVYAGLYAMSDVMIAPVHPTLGLNELYRVLCVTNTTRFADSNDIADYDAFVQADIANSPLAGLSTNWRALASTASVSASAHTGTDPSPPGANGVKIYLPDGTLVAANYDELWSGTLLNAPAITASRTSSAASPWTWTGTDAFGNASNPLGSGAANYGNSSVTGLQWVQLGAGIVQQSLRLFAISDVMQANPYAPAPTYRVLCVTKGKRDATSSDIADYDAFVNADIANSPLAGRNVNWRALVSTSTVSARDHVDIPTPANCPIFTPEGFLIAQDVADLFDGSLARSPVMNSWFETGGQFVFTGSAASGLGSLVLGGDSVRVGDSSEADSTWLDAITRSGSDELSFYAISDVITPSAGQYLFNIPGQNPQALVESSTPPVLGSTWQPIIDHTFFMENATSDVLMFGTQNIYFDIPEIGMLFTVPEFTISTTPGQPFSLAIPANVGLAGLGFRTQGASVSATPEIRLTNAIDMWIGH